MSLIVSAKRGLVGVPARADVANIFPTSQRVTFEGNPLLLVRHGIDETKVLRNLGFDVPAPILSHYDWEGGTPFEVQRKTAALLTMNRRAYVLNGMGTGKTKAALWAWRYLHGRGECGRLLVVAPLSTLNFTWAKEVFNTLRGINARVLYGTRERRLRLLADPDAHVFIVNHDGLQVISDALKEMPDIDTLVLDELAVYRNGQSRRTKLAREVAKRMKFVWGMTGSPTPNLPTDAWAQCTIVTPGTVPRYFNRFRDETMTKVTQFKYVPKANALDRVFEVMQPAVRFELDDVVELPDIVERTIDIDMGPLQAKVYKEMESQASSMVSGGEITAMNAGAVLSKLLQISTGWVYNRKGETVALDNDNRIRALVDAVNSVSEKVIVFVPFIHALAGIAKALTDEGYDLRTVSGQTPMAQRNEIFNLFQETSSVKALVAHPQCMSHGLTLTSASTIIWFSPTADLEIFDQANARIRRIGQKHKQQILMFQATKAEKHIYAKLRNKQKVQNLLLDLFAEATD